MDTFKLLKQIKLALDWRTRNSKFEDFYCFMPNIYYLLVPEESRSNVEDTPVFVKVPSEKDGDIKWIKDLMYKEFSLYPYSITSTPYCKIIIYNTDIGRIIILADYAETLYTSEELRTIVSKLGIDEWKATSVRELAHYTTVYLSSMEKLVFSSVMGGKMLPNLTSINRIIIGLMYAAETYLFSRKYMNADEMLMKLSTDTALFEEFKTSMSNDFKALIKSLQ